MAIALDTSVDGGTATATTLTYSHTCTGSQLILFVSAVVSTQTISGVTYNGVAMTSVGTAGPGARHGSMWYLINPAAGAHNVVVTATGSDTINACSSSYTGVSQANRIDSSNTGSNSSTSITVSTTTVQDNCWVVSGGFTEASVATAGANTTVRKSTASAWHPFIADTNAAQTPAGSKGQAVNCSNGDNGMIVASIAPSDTNARYWVGGTGTWDNTSIAHWSLSSNGAATAIPPQSYNSAVIDGSSGSGTITTGASLAVSSLTMTGYTGTLAGSNTLNVGGSLTFASGMTLSYTGAITLSATSSGQTFTFAGKTIASTLTFDGVGGVWTFQDSGTVSSSVTLTNGTIALGATTLTLSGTGTVWSAAGTVTAGTSTINLTNSSSSAKTFAGGGKTYNNLTFTSGSSGTYALTGSNTFNNFYHTGAGTGALSITGSNTFADFKVDTPPHTVTFTAGTTQTLQTFTVSGTAGNLITLQSSANGSSWYMVKSTTGTISRDYLSIRDSHVK